MLFILLLGFFYMVLTIIERPTTLPEAHHNNPSMIFQSPNAITHLKAT